jgi:hypothetical protein
MKELKNIAAICDPDPRQSALGCYDRQSGKYRQKTLDDHYAIICEIKLFDSVPQLIRDHFETARNLLLYSWFVYRFVTVAEFHAYACLEFALRTRVGDGLKKRKGEPGLKQLLKFAIEQRWVKDEGFRIYKQSKLGCIDSLESIGESRFLFEQATSTDPQRYAKLLAETFPEIRNEFAHGTPRVWPGGYATLQLVADIINQLFPTADAQ